MKKRFLFIIPLLTVTLLLQMGCPEPDTEPDPDPYIVTYTVTYDGNGNVDGDAPGDGTAYEEGTTVVVLDNIDSNLRRIPEPGTAEAFKFDGWNTKVDGNGTDYAELSTFIMGNTDVILYARWVKFELRDRIPAPTAAPEGGLIFYDKGSFTDGWRYLEAATIDLNIYSATSIWSLSASSITEGTSIEIGAGQTNSDAIVVDTGTEINAAYSCLYYSEDPYSDWFLPSQAELNMMYINLHSGTDENSVVYTTVGGFGDNIYWSSSEVDSDQAWSQYFSNGNQLDTHLKSSPWYVRPVRAF
jgi:hypothetical protein